MMLCEVNKENKDATDGTTMVYLVQALQNLYLLFSTDNHTVSFELLQVYIL